MCHAGVIPYLAAFLARAFTLRGPSRPAEDSWISQPIRIPPAPCTSVSVWIHDRGPTGVRTSLSARCPSATDARTIRSWYALCSSDSTAWCRASSSDRSCTASRRPFRSRRYIHATTPASRHTPPHCRPRSGTGTPLSAYSRSVWYSRSHSPGLLSQPRFSRVRSSSIRNFSCQTMFANACRLPPRRNSLFDGRSRH